ncbi:histidine kinase [Saccharomonospora sp. NPDC006951]
MNAVSGISRPPMRDVWVSAGYVLVAVAFVFVPAGGIEWRPGPSSLVVTGSIVAAAVLGLVHVFRRSVPGAVVVTGVVTLVTEAAVTGTTSFGVILLACDALYCLVITRSIPQTWRLLPALAAGCLSLAVVGLLLAPVLAAPLVQMTILFLAVGVTLWWGVSVRIPMNEADHERERAALLAEAAEAKQREVVTAERLQISREMHDAISGHLSAIAMQSAAATAAPQPLEAAELRSRMERVRALSLDAMADMRTLIEVLRTEESGPITVPCDWSSVTELIEQARATGTAVTMIGDDPRSVDLDHPGGIAACNVVREALVNATKHAQGGEVTIVITRRDDELEIAATNRCEATNSVTTPGSGYGLVGLAERVRLCGGDLQVDRSGGSWTLRACLPLSGKQEVSHA